MEGFSGIAVLVIIIVINVLARAFGGKKKSTKQQQKIEEQKRRREAWEAAQKQQKPQQSTAQSIMDEIATAVKEFEVEVTGNHPWASSPATKPVEQKVAMEPQVSVQEVAMDSNIPMDTAKPVQNGSSVHLQPLGKELATTAYKTDATPWIADTLDELHPNRHSFTKKQLKHGIIMAEILGPCRAKAKKVRA